VLKSDLARLFVSGHGGVGKSYLINHLVKEVRHEFEDASSGGDADLPTVAVLAPTGIAAYNVNGCTLHSFFSLPVQHGTEKGFRPLHKMDEKEKRVRFLSVYCYYCAFFSVFHLLQRFWKNVQLIIVDESSMVSATMLHWVEHRLSQV